MRFFLFFYNSDIHRTGVALTVNQEVLEQLRSNLLWINQQRESGKMTRIFSRPVQIFFRQWPRLFQWRNLHGLFDDKNHIKNRQREREGKDKGE